MSIDQGCIIVEKLIFEVELSFQDDGRTLKALYKREKLPR